MDITYKTWKLVQKNKGEKKIEAWSKAFLPEWLGGQKEEVIWGEKGRI